MKKTLCWFFLLCLLPLCAALGEEAGSVYDPALYEGKLAVWFFSLTGEDHTGESILIRTPEGRCLLMDAGIPEVGNQVNDCLARLGVEGLDAVLATHMHIDHVGGLPAVMARHPVGVLYTSPFTAYETAPVARLKAAAAAQQLALTPLLAGDAFSLGEAHIQVLAPFETPVPQNPDSISGDFLNDSSVVCCLTYGDVRFLFPGDATRMVETELVKRYGEALQADVIKVPHHGSTDASSRPFVQAVNAKESVMCIYAFNDFNIYDRYKKVGNRPWVTSLDGTVLCVTDGESLAFYTEKERQGMLK